MKKLPYIALIVASAATYLWWTPLWAQDNNNPLALIHAELQAYQRWDLILLTVLFAATVGLSLLQRRMQRKQIFKQRAPLLLLDDQAKAKLVLRNGAEVWLPYTIPLFDTTTKLGSVPQLLLENGEAEPEESIFEVLSSPFVDEEHCVIQAMQDGFRIFNVARFGDTVVDGFLVPPEGLPLTPGAVITMGNVEYVFLPRKGARAYRAR